jgi:hypothetical protein
MPAIDRGRAVDAADVLNDFIGDFITGVMVFREYEAQARAGKVPLDMMVGIQKMCVSHLVLAFAKFEEFWKHYHDVVPGEHREACRAIRTTIRERKVSEFRNRCVGHIWSNDARRPLKHSEVMEALQTLVNQDLGAFLRWINNPEANAYPSTVVSVIEAVRDAIVAEHGIRPEEIVDR